MSLAYRIVGSHHDAEDAVQAAWIRLQTVEPSQISNPDGWFTTVTARLCFDLLRGRKQRGELPLLSDDIPGEQLAADEALLRREDVSRALLVVLDELTPRQRVAYVLHDLFAVPFDEIAAVLNTRPEAAKKLASRARMRLRGAQPEERGAGAANHLKIIDAFLTAARGGDVARLITLMAPDAVRTADLRLLPAGTPTVVRGGRAVAEETAFFAGRIASAVPVLIDGSPGAVIAPGGHGYALIRVRILGALVTAVDIVPYTPGSVSLATAG